MELTLNHNFEDFLEPDGRNVIRFVRGYDLFLTYGGRGGAKSHGWAEIFITMMRYREGYKLLCAREFQNSIEDSVYSLLQEKADKMFPGFFEFKNSRVYGLNGSYASFKGLSRNIGSTKSLEGYDACWVEEGQYISAKAWEILEPTIRKEDSIIAVSMNRDSEDAILDKTFIQNTPPETAIVKKINYYDNPHPIPKLERMAAQCKKANYDAYQHIWEGELNNISETQVLHGKWRVANFITPQGVTFYHGADWSNGGADPHTVNRSFIANNKLYIDYEVRTNVDPDKLAEQWTKIPTLKPNSGWKVYADSARPDLIRKMCKAGYDVEKAPKSWKGAVHEDDVKKAGKDRFREYDEIVIHERCVHTAKEAKSWQWEIDDRTGDIIPKFKKGNDHHWDAMRYGHWKSIKQFQQAEANIL